ncbi:MAG: glycosyltransferase [Verrucomicrobiota bacterium]
MDLFIWIFLGVAAIGSAAGWFILAPFRNVPAAAEKSPAQLTIIIPARDEAENLRQLLPSIGDQNLEVIVVDDHSSDETSEVAQELGARVLTGKPLPEGWKGKPWACSQGAAAAESNWLLFLDADTKLEPGGLERIAKLVSTDDEVHAICPYHKVERPYEQLSAFFNVIMSGGTTPSGLFGQAMLISRKFYEQTGGHSAVKGEVLENFILANHFKANGATCRSHLDRGSISMRMFPDGLRALTDGWAKGIVSGASNTPRPALIAISAWLSGLIMSVVLLTFIPMASGAALIGIAVFYAICVVQTWILFRRVGSFHPLIALFYPIGLVFYQWVFFKAKRRAKTGETILWKGRDVG